MPIPARQYTTPPILPKEEQPPFIKISGHVIPVTKYSTDASTSNYILIRFISAGYKLDRAQKIADLGKSCDNPHSTNTRSVLYFTSLTLITGATQCDSEGGGLHVYHYEGEDLQQFRDLPFVDYASVYPNLFKCVSPKLRDIFKSGISAEDFEDLCLKVNGFDHPTSSGMGAAVEKTLPLVIRLHRRPEGIITNVAAKLKAHGLIAEHDTYLDENGFEIWTRVKSAAISAIVCTDEVHQVVIVTPNVLF